MILKAYLSIPLVFGVICIANAQAPDSFDQNAPTEEEIQSAIDAFNLSKAEERAQLMTEAAATMPSDTEEFTAPKAIAIEEPEITKPIQEEEPKKALLVKGKPSESESQAAEAETAEAETAEAETAEAETAEAETAEAETAEAETAEAETAEAETAEAETAEAETAEAETAEAETAEAETAEAETTEIEIVTTDKPKGLEVRVESIRTGSGKTDPDQIELKTSFPVKALGNAPDGWRLSTSKQAPPFIREVELEPGVFVSLEISPHLLEPASDGFNHFSVAEPGFDPKLGYQQLETIGSILGKSTSKLDEDSLRMGNALSELYRILASLPKPSETPENP